MDETQITQILAKLGFNNEYFVGVLPANQNIDRFIKQSATYGLIINTDNIGEPGTHWCALHVGKNNTLYFFDSYGRHPKQLSNIWGTLKRFKNKKLVYSNIPIQSIISGNCGLYSIYFLFFMHYYLENMSVFLQIFNHVNLDKNDDIINNLFEEILYVLNIDKIV